MNKMFAVLKREYLQTVRKKSFIIMTLIFPFLMSALMVVPGVIMAKGMGVKRIAVLDGTGKLREAFARPNEPEKVEKEDAAKKAQEALSGGRSGPQLPAQMQIEYVDFSGKNLTDDSKSYLTRLAGDKDATGKLEGVFAIPSNATTGKDAQFTYYSRAATELMMQERLARMANKSLQRLRLTENGMNPALIDQLIRDIPVGGVQLSRSGEQKKGGELNFIVAFLFGALLVLPTLIYGQEIMRGIVQEKSDRVVEVLVSSMSPMNLLSGKILGIALVGLTQIFVWMTMLALVGGYGAAVMTMADVNIAQFVRPVVFVFFFLFFVLAYLTYVCIYAIAGAACNTEREAQQFMGPIMIVMLMPWILMMPIVLNPDAPFAVAFSMAPVFGPITMFVRTLVSEPPTWHILVSIGVSLLTILGFFWVTAKVFRVGILSYGKRPTIPELWKWVKVA
jgi:ABC-2 type transport system permease protein